ncbi:MAG: ATP-binding protein [Pirellulales bacterium]
MWTASRTRTSAAAPKAEWEILLFKNEESQLPYRTLTAPPSTTGRPSTRLARPTVQDYLKLPASEADKVGCGQKQFDTFGVPSRLSRWQTGVMEKQPHGARMPIPHPDFRRTWLWQHVFVNQRLDATIDEQEFFRDQFLLMRENVGHLVARIALDMPGMTVHDLTHLDALWETASLVAEGSITVSPPEGFVLGASILLHDSAMTVAAYPGGIAQIQQTIAWKDAIARWSQSQREAGRGEVDAEDPAADVVRLILPDVLRRLHAQQAAVLAEQAWGNYSGEQQYLIADNDLRFFYGKTIGEIAHSHWWSVHRVEQELSQDLGALPQRTRNLVDRVKVACLLRVADALHLDQLRAPRFLRTLIQPQGLSALHWSFQEKLARPHIESDAVVFTTGQPFNRNDAEAWWLAYDTLSLVDRELRNVDLLLQARGREALKARRVKGVGSPEALAKTVQTRDWRPVDARIKVSDVPRIVESLGGATLYGDDPLVPLRELIQNAADAVQARRRLQRRPIDWGEIRVSIKSRDDGDWLVVEDNGVGMSELVLTGPLLDFGTSFWRSPLVMDEFPGLVASGMQAIGRFGIGFFSVFMLGDIVRVISRRCDKGEESARVLEIRGGPGGRPILWPSNSGEAPLDGGTRVEVCLRDNPHTENGFLWSGKYAKRPLSLARVVAALAPSLDVSLASEDDANVRLVVRAGDWLNIADAELLRRLSFTQDNEKPAGSMVTLMRHLNSADGNVFGRATISPDSYYRAGSGCVTVSGLRANPLSNVQGVLAGEAITAARDVALPMVPKDILAAWATEQAELLLEARLDEERKARAAETVLECGGDIGKLPIVRWGGKWLSADDFMKKVASVEELVLNFAGEFSYDEDQDPMHPREFKDDFEESKTVIMVPRHDGSIVNARGIKWPGSLYPDRSGTNRLSDLVRQIVHDTWLSDFDESEETRIVGKAAGYDVERNVAIFTRAEPDDMDKDN